MLHEGCVFDVAWNKERQAEDGNQRLYYTWHNSRLELHVGKASKTESELHTERTLKKDNSGIRGEK